MPWHHSFQSSLQTCAVFNPFPRSLKLWRSCPHHQVQVWGHIWQRHQQVPPGVPLHVHDHQRCNECPGRDVPIHCYQRPPPRHGPACTDSPARAPELCPGEQRPFTVSLTFSPQAEAIYGILRLLPVHLPFTVPSEFFQSIGRLWCTAV